MNFRINFIGNFSGLTFFALIINLNYLIFILDLFSLLFMRLFHITFINFLKVYPVSFILIPLLTLPHFALPHFAFLYVKAIVLVLAISQNSFQYHFFSLYLPQRHFFIYLFLSFLSIIFLVFFLFPLIVFSILFLPLFDMEGLLFYFFHQILIYFGLMIFAIL